MITKHKSKKKNENQLRYRIVLGYAALLVIFGFILEPPNEIIKGLGHIITSRDALITDYFVIGGMGASFVNAGLLTMIFTYILKFYKVPFTGPSYAALFLSAGFSLFGKNLFNVWPVFIGVYVYSKVVKESFSKFIYIAIFGTALAPLFSEIIYMNDLNLAIRIPVGFFISFLCGFILPPLSTHLIKIHQGFNLYNIGFTAGIIGMVAISVLRSFGIAIEPRLLWSTGNNVLLAIFLLFYFLSMVGIGIALDGKDIWKRIKAANHYKGRLITDLLQFEGTSTTLINMGLLGCLGTFYILIIGGDLNGPTIGGILTITAFGAFGKNLKNVTPILIGVSFAALLKDFDINDPSLQLAALFGTSLAPIAGEFGPLVGILAGFLHSSVVLNVGYLHAGVNLYNNGFSAGFVAAILAPIIDEFRKDEID
jgi:Protein of unknown function (DUF1576)